MVQYTFIGWVWEASAAHLYEVHVWDTPMGISLFALDQDDNHASNLSWGSSCIEIV